jgi:hypothetical protein
MSLKAYRKQLKKSGVKKSERQVLLQPLRDYRSELKAQGVRTDERQNQLAYLSSAAAAQLKEQRRLDKIGGKQQDAFAAQFAAQGQFLNQAIDALGRDSGAQIAQYESLLGSIMSSQFSQMEQLRSQFASENERSNQIIADLESTISRLNRPPDLDLRSDKQAALVGISGGSQRSRQRQMLGTQGLRGPRNARVGTNLGI